MKVKVDFSALLATIIVLYCNGGMLSFLKVSSMTTLLVYSVAVIWIFFAIFKDRSSLSQYISVCFSVILFFVLLNLLMLVINSSIVSSMSVMRKNIMFLLLFVAIFIYYSSSVRKVGRKTILYFWGLDTISASIYTIYKLIEEPTLSRILATGSPELYLESGFSTAGVFGFGSIYGLIFIVTAMISLLKKTKAFYKIIMISCIVLFVYTIIQAQFFIAAVLCVLGIIMGFFGDKGITPKRVVLFIILSPLIIVALYAIVNNLLPALAYSGVLPSFISDRMLLFVEGISMNEALNTSRGIVYLESLSAIIDSIGLGIILFENVSTGQHSEILDLIAVYGAPLSLVLTHGIWRIKKYVNCIIPEEQKHNYNIIWGLFLLMSLLNTSLWCQTTISVFLVIPLLYMEFCSGTTEGN